jgi:hypothetical protein
VRSKSSSPAVLYSTAQKGIVPTASSILLASETNLRFYSCRKKDSNKALESPPRTPFSSTFSLSDDNLPGRDIVPQRSPRAAQSNRLSYGYSEASDEELDQRLGQDSEAARYLRQFQTTASQQEVWIRPRPQMSRSSASIAAMSNAPSLSHTPASTASLSLPYTPSSRPLPPRSYHARASSSFSAKSVDLVLPYASQTPPTAPASVSHSFKTPAGARTYTENAEGELLYEKRRTIPCASPVTAGSLKKLLDFADPLATPQARPRPIDRPTTGEDSLDAAYASKTPR